MIFFIKLIQSPLSKFLPKTLILNYLNKLIIFQICLIMKKIKFVFSTLLLMGVMLCMSDTVSAQAAKKFDAKAKVAEKVQKFDKAQRLEKLKTVKSTIAKKKGTATNLKSNSAKTLQPKKNGKTYTPFVTPNINVTGNTNNPGAKIPSVQQRVQDRINGLKKP